MVVLADEILESFFETDFSATFRLEPVPLMDIPNSNSGLLGGLWQNIATDDNRKILNKFTDDFGKVIGKHQVRLPPPRPPTRCATLTPSPPPLAVTGLHPPRNREVHDAGGAQSARVPPYADDAALRVQSEPHEPH